MKTLLPLAYFMALILVGCAQQMVVERNLSAVDESAPPGRKSIQPQNEGERLKLIRQASTWTDDQTFSRPGQGGRTLANGPQYSSIELQKILDSGELKCRFEEFDKDDMPNGRTPKFYCTVLVKDKTVSLKVKYQTKNESNDGIFGESLSTRLFWKLGFPADAIYRSHVICENCPSQPWTYLWAEMEKTKLEHDKTCDFSKSDEEIMKSEACRETLNELIAGRVRKTVTFEDAEIEVKFPAPTIERTAHQGWTWSEFDQLDLEDGVSPNRKAQREALALLAAFIQHADNKAEQQRLVCMDQNIPKHPGSYQCQKPLLMIQDLGFTFGAGFHEGMAKELETASLKGFSNAPLWRDPKTCETEVLFYVTGQSANKKISEAGRKFLADRLDRHNLTDQDLRDIFTSAEILRKDDKATIEAWIEAFRERANQIIEHHCPP